MAFELSTPAKALLAVVAVQFLLSLGLTVWRLIDLLGAGGDDAVNDAISAAVLLVNLGFFLFHCIIGVTREQTEALLAFCFAAVLLTAYEVFRFANKWIDTGSFLQLGALNYVRFFSVAILTPVSLVLAGMVFRQFGWRDYKLVGADIELLTIFKQYKRFATFLIIDLQMAITLLTFGVVTLLIQPEQEAFDIINVAGFALFTVITVIWVLLGLWATRHEHKNGMVWWGFLSLMEPAFIANCIYQFVFTNDYEDYTELTNPFIVLAALALVIRLAVVIMGVQVTRNFGRGLRYRVFAKMGRESDAVDDLAPLDINM